MLKVTFTGLRERLQTLDRLERDQLPFAAAAALTWTAKDVEAELQSEMRAVFDRPTPWTLNSLFTQPATKGNMEAKVWMKDQPQDGGGRSAADQLAPQVRGGTREAKRSETMLRDSGRLPSSQFVMPGNGVKLDAYGNISRGTMNKILSGLGSQQDRHANSTMSRRSAKNFKRYFILKKGGRPLGIAERTSRGKAGMRMVIAFGRRPTYSKLFDFFGVSQRCAGERLPIRFEQALARAVPSRI